jgi:hypothetical protein
MIGNDIYIIDDVIPLDTQDEIEDLFTSSRLAWVFHKDIALDPMDIKKLGITKLTPGIGCNIKQHLPKYLNLNLLNRVKIIAEQACIGIDKKLKEIYQARSFMHFPISADSRNEFDNIHIDIPFEHLVVLYYVNDTDGDTFIFDKFADLNNLKSPTLKENEVSVIKKISPKKGRALVFDGRRYHSSSAPTKNIRCIINFDIAIK